MCIDLIPTLDWQCRFSLLDTSSITFTIDQSAPETTISTLLLNGTFSDLEWQPGGNVFWSVINNDSSDGFYSSKSGSIDHNMTSDLAVTMDVVEDGFISFYKKVSCEDVGTQTGNYYDYLAFYIDDIEQDKWAGESDWSNVSFSVSAGDHELRWRFNKDQGVLAGDDAVWIDQIVFPPCDNLSGSLGDLNSDGDIVLRLNGYQSTQKMHSVLDYVSSKSYLNESFAKYINKSKQNVKGKLNKNPIFENGPHVLARSSALPAQSYLAVFFEEPNCAECDIFHSTIMQLDKTKELLKPMQVVRLNAISDEKVITPDGTRTTASKWYEELKLTYKPAIVFYDKEGIEIIRKDAMFKEYHLLGILTYVVSADYINQPNFQRYLEQKSDLLREQGITVDIWK